ncbi:MAG: hypothetical protein M3308_06770 [Actinomycetota bacterium]|nr:hypothetical protein [Actinomycetota bacterium]
MERQRSRPACARIRAGRRHHIEQEGTFVLTFFLMICLTYLVVLVGVMLVLLLSWRRTRRAATPGKRHRRDGVPFR